MSASFQVSPQAEAQGDGVESNRSAFLLSIDGGGIRGLSSLIILREVLYRIKIRGNLDDIPRPCDLFDLAGGTGTGGLIVLMLFRLKMTIDQAIETYVQFTRDVFDKQWFMKEAFSAKAFKRAIVKILQKYEDFSNPLEARLLDSGLEGHGKAFLCAYDTRNMASPVLFRTYTARKNPSYNCTIVEGARATCATPKIFKSIDIGPDYLRSTYIGGEWRSNNPSQFVLSEADDLLLQPISCLLSIGTGRINNLDFDHSSNLSQVLKHIAGDCETTHQRTAQQFKSDVYFRLNVEQGLQASWMDSKNLRDVAAHTRQYLMEAEINQRVDLLVEKLFMSKVEPKKPASDQDTVHGPVMPSTDAKASLPVWNPSINATTKSTPLNTPPPTTMTTNQKPKPFNTFAPMPVARHAPFPPESASKSKSGSPSSAPKHTAAITQGIGTGYTVTSTTKQPQNTDPSSVPSSNTNSNASTTAKPPQNGIGYGLSKTQPMPVPSNNTNGHASTSKPSMNGIPPRRQDLHLPLPTPSKIPNSVMLGMNSMSAVLKDIDLMDGESDGKQKKTLRHTTDRGTERSCDPVQVLGGKRKEKEVLKEERMEDEDIFKINPHPDSNSNSSTSPQISTPSGSQAPGDASIFSNMGSVSIYGGSFVTLNQENIHEKFVNHIIPDAFHDAAASFALPKCYPGTREAIMRDLIHWFEQDCRAYPLYHLYAPVGSGKTAIAKTLADHFSNYDDPSKNLLLATFFFSRTTESRSNARAFIATIAYQVAMNLPPVATHIMEAATSDPAIFERDIFVQMRTLLLNPLRHACTVELKCGQATSHWPRLIVIDGLNECYNTESQINILRVITELARYRPFPLAIFLSCRRELHIRSSFMDPHLSRLALKTDLSNRKYDSESDIRRFLESKFREIRNSHCVTTGIILPSDWPGPKIIEKLVGKSSGHFIYPSLVVKYVGALDDNPADRLKVVLGLPESRPDSLTAAEQPFRQLDAMYSQMLASIKPNSLPAVRNAFCFALVPYGGSMLLDELQTRVHVGNLEGNLISLSPHKPKGRRPEIAVAFLHPSFSDFLLDPARSGRYFIDLKGAHAHIAVYLLNNYIENNTGKESSARAIYSLIGHLREAAPTEALRDRLRRMSDVTTFTKIFKNCNRPDDRGLSFDVWKVLQSLASCLGQMAFEESSTMEENLLQMMKSHLRKELEKYTEGPLNQLIALLMCGARFPQDFVGQRSPWESSVEEALVSLIWQQFDFFSDVRTTDESSLNLLVFLKVAVDQACLRNLIAETGYTVDPGVYTKACINALKCIAEISGGNPKNSPLSWRGNSRNVNLSSEFFFFRQAVENVRQNRGLDSIPLASLFINFFTDFVVRLLERANTSSADIADYLDDLEDNITLLCRCAKRVNVWDGKAVLRHHQTRVNCPPSPCLSRVVMLPDVRKPDFSRRKSS